MQLEKTLPQVPGEPAAAAATIDSAHGALALPDDALILVPVRNMVLFPGMILPITIGRESSIAGAQQAVKTERPIGIILQRNPEIDQPALDDLHVVGTLANVLRYATTPDGTRAIGNVAAQKEVAIGQATLAPTYLATPEAAAAHGDAASDAVTCAPQSPRPGEDVLLVCK